MTHLFLRADANVSIGTGHLMRCLSLAQAALEQNIEPIFLIREAPPVLLTRLENEGFTYYLLSGLPELEFEVEEVMESAAHEGSGNWIVLDGYHFNAAYQSAYRARGLSVMTIDDYGHADYYEADLVLNPNFYASIDFYPNCAEHTQFLLGSSYALLRKEFWPWRKFQRSILPLAQKLLITMGGSDPTNGTGLVVAALRHAAVAGTEVTIVLGSANQHQEEIVDQAEALPCKVMLVRHTNDMAELLAATDLAISAAGGTTCEMLFMQVPAILISLPDDNQRRVAESVAQIGAGSYLGRADVLDVRVLGREIQSLMQDRKRRQKMVQRGRGFVDGNGAHRVITYLQQIKSQTQKNLLRSNYRGSLGLRSAILEDRDKIFQWRNDPWILSFSSGQRSVGADEHRAWFEKALNDHDHSINVIVLQHEDIGLARLHRTSPEQATISIYLLREFCGKGYGTAAIQLACEKAWTVWPIREINAYTLKTNSVSERSFKKNGFLPVESQEEASTSHLLHLRKTR
jgi:UDP-2,4-diacetamido-2,4,6-trideoxy-beta-L-altropyranose hydrolase